MARSKRSESGGFPHQVTTFVGRRSEIAALKRALQESRLVNLTGPGGVGKTRLALRVAEGVGRTFRDGVHFVDLARVHDPSLVVNAIAEALDLQDQSARSPERALLDYLSDKHLLVVLDNCEHLLESTARTVSEVLASAGDLRILATSREPLNIAGEHVWPVSPLSVPASPESPGIHAEGSHPGQYESVALFVDRARAVVRDFALSPENQQSVAQLCSRLDGLPLAIELAAVRLRALSPEQMLTRLEHRFDLLTDGNRTAPERQQTLHAAMDWSFELCPEPERLLWARCSVFAGEFEVDAAEYVCSGDGIGQGGVFSGVAGLVDKSILVRIDSGNLVRYRMLETIRQFGEERLAEIGSEAQVRRRHRDYYLRLAELCDAESSTARQIDWADRLPRERANLFAALDYCLKNPGEARTGIRMAASLWFYWIACGLVRDAKHWLDRLLTADPEPTPERARALWVAGWAGILQGDNYAGVERLGECHRVATKLHDETAVAHAVQLLGLAKTLHNDPVGATPLLDSAIATHRRRRDWTAAALMSLVQRGFTAATVGDVDVALALANECREICQRQDERWALSWLAYVLALAAWVSKDLDGTVKQARDGYRQKRELGDQLGIPSCIEALAWARVAQGHPDDAATLFGAADAVWQRIGTPLFGDEILLRWSSENRELATSALGRRRYEKRWTKGAQMTSEEMSRFVLGNEDAEASRRGTATEGESSEPRLTRREREVAQLVATGMSNRDIAASLVISQRTAEAHVENILTKMGFTSRTQIAAWVHETAEGPLPNGELADK